MTNKLIKDPKTNEDMLHNLLCEVDGFGAGVLRERIIHIMELTVQDIKENPETWRKSFIHPDIYTNLNKIVQKHLEFENDKTKS